MCRAVADGGSVFGYHALTLSGACVDASLVGGANYVSASGGVMMVASALKIASSMRVSYLKRHVPKQRFGRNWVTSTTEQWWT